MRSAWFVIGSGLIFLVSPRTAASQSGEPLIEPEDHIPGIVSFFAPLFIPKIIQDGYQLKAYIRSEEFARFRESHGDLLAVDAIFHHAVQLSWNNIYEALLISFFGTMDHSKFGVKLPILGPLLWVPLTSEFAGDFETRIQVLPTQLYADTPHGRTGDRDKLQHFFGSAFLTYVFEDREVAERVGGFIELGEQRFIVDGALDQRDTRANTQGQEFGLSLLEDATVCPSRFFQVLPADRMMITPDKSRQDSIQYVLTTELGCQ